MTEHTLLIHNQTTYLGICILVGYITRLCMASNKTRPATSSGEHVIVPIGKINPLIVMRCILSGAGLSCVSSGLIFLCFQAFPVPEYLWLVSGVTNLIYLVLSFLVTSVNLIDKQWEGKSLTHGQSFGLCVRTMPWPMLSILPLFFVFVWWGLGSWLPKPDPFLLGTVVNFGMPIVLFPIMNAHVVKIWKQTDEGKARQRQQSQAGQSRRQRRRICRVLLHLLVLLLLGGIAWLMAQMRGAARRHKYHFLIGTQITKLVIFFSLRRVTAVQRFSTYRAYTFALGCVAVFCDSQMRITVQATETSWDALAFDALIVGVVEVLARMGHASVFKWYYGYLCPNSRLMQLHMVEEYADMAAEYIAIFIAILYQMYFSQSFQLAICSAIFIEVGVDFICIAGLQALAYPIGVMVKHARDRQFLCWNFSLIAVVLLSVCLCLGQRYGT